MGILVRLVAALLVLAALVGGSVLVLGTQQPSVAAGLAPVGVSAEARKSFDGKVGSLVSAANEAKRSGGAKPFEVAFSEEELTSKAAEAVGSSDGAFGVSNPQIHLVGGNVVATSTVSVGGVSLNVGVVATPTVVDGRAQLEVQKVETGALPVPGPLRDQIESQLARAVEAAKAGLPADFTKLAVVDGKLVAAGMIRPR